MMNEWFSFTTFTSGFCDALSVWILNHKCPLKKDKSEDKQPLKQTQECINYNLFSICTVHTEEKKKKAHFKIMPLKKNK